MGRLEKDRLFPLNLKENVSGLQLLEEPFNLWPFQKWAFGGKLFVFEDFTLAHISGKGTCLSVNSSLRRLSEEASKATSWRQGLRSFSRLGWLVGWFLYQLRNKPVISKEIFTQPLL